MTEQDQIKALAELAGASKEQMDWVIKNYPPDYKYHPANYLTSYDAIIPLIQKQDRKILVRIVLGIKTGQNDVARMVDWLQMTPAQLCEALLRAHGKWKK